MRQAGRLRRPARPFMPPHIEKRQCIWEEKGNILAQQENAYTRIGSVDEACWGAVDGEDDDHDEPEEGEDVQLTLDVVDVAGVENQEAH